MVEHVHKIRAKRMILVIAIFKSTAFSVSLSSLCQHNFSSALNNLRYRHRYEGRSLKVTEVKTDKVTSEIQWLDLCLRESLCASLNLKRKWKAKKGISKLLCEINAESWRTNGARMTEKVNSTHLDINADQIREVNPFFKFFSYNPVKL